MLGTSWWLEEAAAAFGDDVADPLEGTVDADVCIVGGGFTGLWTALAVKERDPSAHVVLLEAERCGVAHWVVVLLFRSVGSRGVGQP